MRDESSDAIVVTESELVVCQRVVLVHHRNHPKVEQSLEGVASVKVLSSVKEVVRGEQGLAGNQPDSGERLVPRFHQPGLPDGRHGLLSEHVVRTGHTKRL